MDYEAELIALETRTDQALGQLEQDGRWAEALEIYRAAGEEADALAIPKDHAAYQQGRKLRAYLYLREANALRALGRHAEAVVLGDKELSAAIASRHRLSIAQAMFSLGSSCLATGETERGLKMLADSRPMFAHGDDDAHREALGWWHIIHADLVNSGVIAAPPEQALADAGSALNILRPLNNWSGIARAHAARAAAYVRLGREDFAQVARTAARMAEDMGRLAAAQAHDDHHHHHDHDHDHPHDH
jgi:tetratricopeptide (TPR) repeat protein